MLIYSYSKILNKFVNLSLQINPSLPSNSSCGDASAVGGAVVGKSGANYKKHGAFCLETQKYADAVHHVRRIERMKTFSFRN
jgi:hypothetical protein